VDDDGYIDDDDDSNKIIPNRDSLVVRALIEHLSLIAIT